MEGERKEGSMEGRERGRKVVRKEREGGRQVGSKEGREGGRKEGREGRRDEERKKGRGIRREK